MHANVHADRDKGSWRLPQDETLQVSDAKKQKSNDMSSYAYDGHNWRSIIFSLLVIGMVITGIVTAIYLLGYVDELLYWSGRRMNFNEFLQDELNPKKLPSTWISYNYLVFQADDGSLMLLDTENDTMTTLVTNHTLRQLNVKGYQCSMNLRYILLQHNIKKVFRQSYTAHYTIYDITNEHHIPIRLRNTSKTQYQRLQYVTWVGSTSALILVMANDIYLRPSPISDQDYRLTFSGQSDLIYNGIPDWLYQEEILRFAEAMWTSPDSSHLLYATFNDSRTSTMSYTWLNVGAIFKSDNSSSFADNFPETKTLHYPRAGSTNPTVQLWILNLTDLSSMQLTKVTPPSTIINENYYFTSAGWISNVNDKISIMWMNRAQNVSIVSICNAPDWICVEVHAERSIENAWLNVPPHPLFSPDGRSFLMLAPVQEGNSEFYTHIKHVTLQDEHIAVLSHGKYEVETILAWDSANHIIYYEAISNENMRQRHIFSVYDPNTEINKRFETECLTCNLSERLATKHNHNFNNCSYFNALLSPKNDKFRNTGITHVVFECKGPTMPVSGLFLLKNMKFLRLLYNTRLGYISKRLKQLAFPIYRSLDVPLPYGNQAQVQLLLPPSWREELRDATYPVIIQINGKPGEKIVTDKFLVDWGTFMCSRNDIVYIKVDVRGSLGPSNQKLYKQIGGIEVDDQIIVINYLLNHYKFLDRNRIAIWGRGYGGFVTLMLLSSQKSIFKCGIAISPITDWLYYNSAFTERVLGFPDENYKSYVEADATQRAKSIPSNSLLLIHGMADLTVPYTHSLALIKSLIKAGVIFRFQNYPDEGHELSNVLDHVYMSMEDFLGQCLNLDVEN